jgi:hypothetical protein
MIQPSPAAGQASPSRGVVEFAAASFEASSPTPATTFSRGDRIFWRAQFAPPAQSVRVHVVTIRCHRSGWEEVVSGHTMWLSHPHVPGYAGWLGPGAYAGIGRYLVRVVSGRAVLAEGSFEVTERETGSAVH